MKAKNENYANHLLASVSINVVFCQKSSYYSYNGKQAHFHAMLKILAILIVKYHVIFNN